MAEQPDECRQGRKDAYLDAAKKKKKKKLDRAQRHGDD